MKIPYCILLKIMNIHKIKVKKIKKKGISFCVYVKSALQN